MCGCETTILHTDPRLAPSPGCIHGNRTELLGIGLEMCYCQDARWFIGVHQILNIQCDCSSSEHLLEWVGKQEKTAAVVTPRVRLALPFVKAADADAADTHHTHKIR